MIKSATSFSKIQALALTAVIFGSVVLAVPPKARAQSTEDRFHDLFVTAGYSAAFGAAMGAAVLAFVPDPGEKLSYISVGASLGFIGGSILGSYVIFQPMLTMGTPGGDQNLNPTDSKPVRQPLALLSKPDYWAQSQIDPHKMTLVLSPAIDGKTKKITQIESVLTLYRF